MKKSILALTALLISGVIMAQQWELGTNFQYIKPLGNMSTTIKQGFGGTLEGAYNFKKPFSLGMEVSYTNYGHQEQRQQYTFDDGSITETNVIVDNYFVNLNFTGKYFLRNTKLVNPYLSGKLGYSWYRTALTIEDPDDQYSCHPIESDILAKDGTFIATGGAGVRVDFSSVFKNMVSNSFFLDVSAHMTQGGTVRYMNVDHHPVTTPERDVMAKFINTQTEVIHEHHVGYLYTSLVNMMQYRLGVIFKPAGWGK
jgi:uncharacterized protein YdeI (BOF family)